MSRYLLIDTDEQTIVTVLSMPLEDAIANRQVGQKLIELDPATDNGASIRSSVIYVSGTNELIDTKTTLPPPGLVNIVLTVVD